MKIAKLNVPFRYFRFCVLLRLTDINAAIHRAKFDLGPATVDGTQKTSIDVDPNRSTTPTRVYDSGLTAGPHLNIEIGPDVPVIGAELEVRLGVGRERDVNAAIHRDKRHG